MKLNIIICSTLLLIAGVSQAVTPLKRDPYRHFSEVFDQYKASYQKNSDKANLSLLNDIVSSYDYILSLNPKQRDITKKHVDMKIGKWIFSIDELRQQRNILQARLEKQAKPAKPAQKPAKEEGKEKMEILPAYEEEEAPPAYEEEIPSEVFPTYEEYEKKTKQ